MTAWVKWAGAELYHTWLGDMVEIFSQRLTLWKQCNEACRQNTRSNPWAVIQVQHCDTSPTRNTGHFDHDDDVTDADAGYATGFWDGRVRW